MSYYIIFDIQALLRLRGSLTTRFSKYRGFFKAQNRVMLLNNTVFFLENLFFAHWIA